MTYLGIAALIVAVVWSLVVLTLVGVALYILLRDDKK